MLFTSSFLVFAMYSASLTSILAVVKVSMPFDSLTSMYFDTNYKVGTIRGSSFESAIKDGTELERKIYLERYDMVQNVQEGLQRALDEKYAMIWADDTVNSYVGMQCSHTRVEHAFRRDLVSFAMNKDSEYRELFDF